MSETPPDALPGGDRVDSGADSASRAVALEQLFARTRHDVRSALAPALLAAELLAAQPDARVQRHATTVVRAIEKVLQTLEASRAEVSGGRTQDSP